ncbi:methylmalonyl-CoA mutase family protein, partial [Schleiferiaceae bacterium]|nr:methylmalonyl-CoA mutase family protein [Schleiferiaceae bacterium]
YGITRLYHPDDGRKMGLQGMINDLIEQSDFLVGDALPSDAASLGAASTATIARWISAAENCGEQHAAALKEVSEKAGGIATPILGITGTGGAGKSSMVDELVRRFLLDFPKKRLAVVSVDPSKRKTGGALLGDRIRMNAIKNGNVFMRSLATRQANLALSAHVQNALDILKVAGFDLIILETSGIGQSDTEILDHSDASLYVMTPEYGAATQLEKIDMLDFADLIALNKFDKRGALDALRDVKKQYQRNHNLWEQDPDNMPVYGTIASQFNDPGTNSLYSAIIAMLNEKANAGFDSTFTLTGEMSEKIFIIPPNRTRYLSEISESHRIYRDQIMAQVEVADKLYALHRTMETLEDEDVIGQLQLSFDRIKMNLDPHNWERLQQWNATVKRYKDPVYTFHVRGKAVNIETHTESLSHTRIPKVALPKYRSWGDVLRWLLLENVPGEFPYTAGIYPFKREGEDPTRMFAGEGGPERTNKRFHYVSLGLPAKRLSTAFDSVTLYGNDPDRRPDIYGKIGNSGVSICCLDDAKKLYSGFRLTDPSTSVSMTINGPAPMLLAYFMNAAIDQECEHYIKENKLEAKVEALKKAKYDEQGIARPAYQGELPEGNDGLGLLLLGVTGDEILDAKTYGEIKSKTLNTVRGTVQADILKEDQAQNTCIFSTEFALRLMGDVQS